MESYGGSFMSMEHKAFLFNTAKFQIEIRPILEKSLDEGGKDYAITYINQNYLKLMSPYTGEYLDENWMDEIEIGGIQEYIDFILTSCYDPNEDMGLEYAWDALIEAMSKVHVSNDVEYWVLGKPVRYKDIIIDPGAMGLGLVNSEDVVNIKDILLTLQDFVYSIESINTDMGDITHEDIVCAYNELCKIYKIADEKKCGILVTF